MKGIILDYSIQRNDGVITSQDGRRYKFTGADWKADLHPERGQQVDFEVSDGKAVDIYMDLPEVTQPVRPQGTVTNSQPDVVYSVPACKVPTRNKKKVIGIVLICLAVPALIVVVIVVAALSREIPPSEKSDWEKIYKAGNISEEQWMEITADNKITYFELLRLAWSKRER